MNRFAIYAAAFGLSVWAQGALAANACVAPGNVNAMATEIAAGVNASRRANGQSALAYNPQLGRAAMGHACDMTTNGFFDHAGSNGSNVQARVRRSGYRDCLVAENIAWGYPRSNQIIDGWMHSPGHRRNMLHPRATEMGIGIASGAQGPYWVLVVAKGC